MEYGDMRFQFQLLGMYGNVINVVQQKTEAASAALKGPLSSGSRGYVEPSRCAYSTPFYYLLLLQTQLGM